MKKTDWDDFDFGNNDDISDIEQKTNTRQRKRKWREIETFKDRQRLKRELEQYDSYSL